MDFNWPCVGFVYAMRNFDVNLSHFIYEMLQSINKDSKAYMEVNNKDAISFNVPALSLTVINPNALKVALRLYTFVRINNGLFCLFII
jgi:hypothetical protein